MIAQELEVSLHMAFVEARQKRHEFITVEHLLLALCDNPSASEVLKACVPGCESITKVNENEYQVQMTAKVGPVSAKFRGRLSLFHVDLYRLASGEVDDLGLDALAADGVLAVEWAERLPREDAGALHVRLEHAGEDTRRITISGGS